MEEELKKILKQNKDLIWKTERTVYYFRRQNYDIALRQMTEILLILGDMLPKLVENSSYLKEIDNTFQAEEMEQIIKELFEVQKAEDYILLADYYQINLLPILYKLQNIIMSDIKFIPFADNQTYEYNIKLLEDRCPKAYKKLHNWKIETERFQVEFTNSGAYTLKEIQGDKVQYYHSNVNPNNEALQLTEYWYDEQMSRYILYGFGLGYWVEALALIDENIQIDIYENDLSVICLAMRYGNNMYYLESPNITLHYDPTLSLLFEQLEHMDSETCFLIHNPSIARITDTYKREWLEEYFIQYNSVKNQSKLLRGNFRENIKNYDFPADKLIDEWKGKDLYIVAAGPSLDKNCKELKKVGSNGIILATGTVFRKLLKMGIKPDYVIITEANRRVIGQTSGLEESGIPLLFLATAYKYFAESYQGLKYIIFQNGCDYTERYAREHGFRLYETGGSVSTTALDLGIQLGCQKIIFVGLDLSYPNNLVHASDTSRRELADTKGMRKIKDINGKEVYTSKSLDIYRKWIEQRIYKEKDVLFIDATEGGAFIKGTDICKLRELIRSSSVEQ